MAIKNKKEVVSTYLPTTLINKIRHMSVDLKKPISTIIEVALKDYIRKIERRSLK